MRGHKTSGVIAMVMAGLLTTTGIAFALGTGAINQGTDATAEGNYSTVSGGRNNHVPAEGDFATVGGGENNAANREHATVGGGEYNVARARRSTVGGGNGNTATDFEATIGGGGNNTASGNISTVGGGRNNIASGDASTIPGGGTNTASGTGSTIGGGSTNDASGTFSFIGGGAANTASGHASTVLGGEGNTAAGNYSLAAGRHARVNHTGTFVWSDPNDPGFASTGENQFLIRAAGGVGIGTNSPTEELVVGDDFGLKVPDSGNRITVGNGSGRSGLNLGEDKDNRAFILWENNNDYLEFGTRENEDTNGNTLVVKSGNIGIGTTNPTEALEVEGNIKVSGKIITGDDNEPSNLVILREVQRELTLEPGETKSISSTCAEDEAVVGGGPTLFGDDLTVAVSTLFFDGNRSGWSVYFRNDSTESVTELNNGVSALCVKGKMIRGDN